MTCQQSRGMSKDAVVQTQDAQVSDRLVYLSSCIVLHAFMAETCNKQCNSEAFK